MVSGDSSTGASSPFEASEPLLYFTTRVYLRTFRVFVMSSALPELEFTDRPEEAVRRRRLTQPDGTHVARGDDDFDGRILRIRQERLSELRKDRSLVHRPGA